MKYLILFLSILSYSYAQFETAPAYQPFNLSFENSVVGVLPTMWTLPTKDEKLGYQAEATDEQPQDGKYCLKLEYKGKDSISENTNGTIVQSFDASPYIGKKVRFTAYVRAEIKGEGFAGFYVSERTFQNQYPFIHINEDDPIVFNIWKKYTVDYTVSKNAYSLNIGLFLKGKGKAWIDNINVEVINQVKDIEEPSQVSEQFAENLLSFAKAYGYTKFYSPSDEVIKMDSETFLYHSIKALEQSKNQNELHHIIEDRLKRIAPALRLFKDESAANNYHLDKPKDAIDRYAVTEISKNIYFKNGNKNIGTKRYNIYASRMPREGATYQIIGASSLRGKKLKYHAFAKVKPYGLDGHAELWFRVDFKDKSKDPLNIKMPEIISSKEWKEYSMEIEIPEDATQIRTGLVFIGEGKAWFDSVKLTEEKPNITLEYNPKNNSFDERWQYNDIEYWRIPNSVISSGYKFTVDNSKESYDGSSLLISTNKENYVPLPSLGEICSLKITDNMWLALPLTLYSNGENTLPTANPPTEDNITLNPNGRITKIAVFIEMWNYLRSFSTTQLTEKEWDKLFTDNISKIAESKTKDEFITLLNQVLKVTNNIRSEAWHTDKPKDYTLPFIVDFSNEEVLIVESFDKRIEVGDKLISIDGINLNDYLGKSINNYAGNSVNWKKKKAFYKLAEGDFGSSKKIVINRNGDRKSFDVALNMTGREVHIARPRTIEWLDSNIIYIDGTRFGDFEMSKLIDKFRGAKGVIVDLRGASLLSEYFLGFFIDSSITSFKWTLSDYSTPCKRKVTHIIGDAINPKKSVLPHNIVFISNETSVGVSETILRLAKQYNIGTIVGEISAGSYDFMEQVRLPALYNFSFDIYPLSFLGDNKIKYEPVAPDITITDKNGYPNDEKIKKAVAILKKNF